MKTESGGNADVQTTLPDKQVWLGTVHLPGRVRADGTPLPAGTYRIRLTGQHADKNAAGQSERYSSCLRSGQGLPSARTTLRRLETLRRGARERSPAD